MSAWQAGVIVFAIGVLVSWLRAEMDAAPEGWEDEATGFHYGKQPLPSDDDTSEWAEREGGPMCRCGHSYNSHDEHDAACMVSYGPETPCSCDGYTPEPGI